jgi:hypothetical protein
MLSDCRALYMTSGLESLTEIATESVDWQWSHAVLEHIRRSEFTSTVQQLRRSLRTGGVSSHRIDFQDHLGGALNSLRFAPSIWESSAFRNGGFYTNRLRYSEVVDVFISNGFRLEGSERSQWPELPTKRDKLHASFRDVPDGELRIRWADLVFRAV